VQRTAIAACCNLRIQRPRLVQRLFCGHRDVRVDAWVQAFDALQIRARQFLARQLARGDALRGFAYGQRSGIHGARGGRGTRG
jgi:hypothetical protein